jgi:hypothetical protein
LTSVRVYPRTAKVPTFREMEATAERIAYVLESSVGVE